MIKITSLLLLFQNVSLRTTEEVHWGSYVNCYIIIYIIYITWEALCVYTYTHMYVPYSIQTVKKEDSKKERINSIMRFSHLGVGHPLLPSCVGSSELVSWISFTRNCFGQSVLFGQSLTTTQHLLFLLKMRHRTYFHWCCSCHWTNLKIRRTWIWK